MYLEDCLPLTKMLSLLLYCLQLLLEEEYTSLFILEELLLWLVVDALLEEC